MSGNENRPPGHPLVPRRPAVAPRGSGVVAFPLPVPLGLLGVGELLLLLLNGLVALLGGALLVALELVLGCGTTLARVGVEPARLPEQGGTLLQLRSAGADLVIAEETAGEFVGAAEPALDQEST